MLKLSIESLIYLSQLTIEFEPYIRHFNDVLGDSNCGFIVVTVRLGLGEEAWPQVRIDMLSELQNHHQDYTFLYDIPEATINLVHKLSF